MLPDYNVQDHAIVAFGHSVTGISEAGVSINPDGEITNTVRGLGPNDVATTYMGIQGAHIEINLMQTSPTNAVFAEILNEQERQGKVVKGSIEIFSPNNVYTHCDDCYIQSAPNQGFSKTHGDRVWVFYCPKLRYSKTAGGTSFSASVTASINADVNFALSNSFNFKL